MTMDCGFDAHLIVERLKRIRRAMVRRAANRPIRFTVAYHAVLSGVSAAGAVVMTVAVIMTTPGWLDMPDQDLEAMTGGWVGPLSLAASVLAFLFVLLMRRHEIGTRAFWTGGQAVVRMPRATAGGGAIVPAGAPMVVSYGGRRMRPAWLAVFIGLMLAVQAVTLLAQEGFAAVGVDLATPAEDALDAGMGSLCMVLYADVVGPVVEEVVFRGLLMQGLKPLGRVFAIVTSAAMFGLYHDDLVQGLFAFGAGLVLGFVAMEYSLLWSIALHVLNNALLSDVLDRLLQPFGNTGETVAEWAVIAIGVAALVVVFARYGAGLRSYVRTHRAAPGTHWAWTNGWFLAYAIVNGAVAIGSFATAMMG